MKWLLGLALVGLLAANRPSPVEAASGDFKRVGHTARVTYYAAKGQRVDIRRTEAFLERLTSLFGPPPEGWRLDYYRHTSMGTLREHGGLGAIGLTGVIGVTDIAASRIDSLRKFHPHELVHAAAAPLGRPPVFFAEGLAVALTAGGKWEGRDIDVVAREELRRRPSLEPLLDAFTEQDPATAYAIAGSFTTYLLDRYGIEAMVAFLRGCGTSPAGFERAFQAAYGRTVAGLTIEWQQALRDGRPKAAASWQDPEGWPLTLQREQAVTTAVGGASTD